MNNNSISDGSVIIVKYPGNNTAYSDYYSMDEEIKIKDVESALSKSSAHLSKKHQKTYQIDAKYRPFFIFKIVTCISIYALVIIAKLNMPSDNYPVIKDVLFEYTNSINVRINNDRRFAAFLQILSSGLMDLTFLSVMYYWFKYTYTGRIYFAMVLFYGIRGICQQTFLMPFPDGYFFEDPGFPSIVVPYGRTTDFFYSGHVGFLVICASEWFRCDRKIPGFITLLVASFMAFVVCVFRVHYFSDIIFGAIMGNYCHIITHRYIAPFIDRGFAYMRGKLYVITVVECIYEMQNNPKSGVPEKNSL